MRKFRLLVLGAALVLLTIFVASHYLSAVTTKLEVSSTEEREEEEGEAETESLWDRYQQEFEQLRDPATGELPARGLQKANEFTRASQRSAAASRVAGLAWQERGPVYDAVGPSNGNTRAGGEVTAGIVQSFVVDANDATGNTIIVGSPSGGLWRCTNFLSSSTADWQPVNDFMANLAVASICQDPSNPNVMYLATGDANTRDVRGYGVWKSTNAGRNWALLPTTVNFIQAFKILCDNAGNVYLAGGGPLNGTYGGLRRSADGGTTWVNISPANLTGTNPWYVSDLELSSTGRLHGIFGYYGSRVQHFYTDAPATVSSSAGWALSTGIRLSSVACTRIEMATQGNVAYAVTCNSSFNVDSCYKSIDGGATWTLQNTAAYNSAITNTQGWYALELDINPDNPSEFIVGSVDAYRSVNDGLTVSRATYWVGLTAPYVHADHHAIKWYKAGTENRLIIGCDGGVFLSRNGGTSFVDRNRNLGIKQFYSCAISPTADENFLFAGAQDNGCHQLKGAGLSSSTEVTGGDGAYVHINQQNPQVQFGSYVYNQYRRSINNGNNWSSINLSSSTGYFINPFDYDNAKNIMYAGNGGAAANNQIRRWSDANTSSTSTILTLSAMTRNASAGNATSFKMSPYTPNRLFIGTSRGGLLRLENANSVTATDVDNNITDITGSVFPLGGYLNCVNTGTSDNVLVATFTNYGVSNVWVSTNGGSSWTAVDGNLPDMPVWWAEFVPGEDNKLFIATETGVFYTDAVNGSSTVWTAEQGFPLVRTRMLKVRKNDNTLVAATYGRGLWTASLNSCPLSITTAQLGVQTVCAGTPLSLSVTTSGSNITYQWRKGGVNIPGATSASYSFTPSGTTDGGHYDVLISNGCSKLISNPAVVTINRATAITAQPSAQSGCAGTAVNFSVTATGASLTYQWRKGGVNITGATGASYSILSPAAADAGTYDVIVTGACGAVTSSPAALSISAGTTIDQFISTSSICTGSAATFSVTARGTGTLSYQWQKNGVNITGATGATFSIASATVADAGTYNVVVTGNCGSVTWSSPTTLTVNTGGGCVTAVPTIDPDVTSLILLPNLVRQGSLLRVNVQRPMKIDWSVVDAQGKVVMRFSQKLTRGQTDLPLQLHQLTTGRYYLVGTTEKGKLGSVKFEKL